MAKRIFYDAGLECDFFAPAFGVFALPHYIDDEFEPLPRRRRASRFPFPGDEHVWPATVTNFRFIFGDETEVPIFRRRSGFIRWIDLDDDVGIFGTKGPDTLRFYLSGAGSDGGVQTSNAASLGGYRSSTEVQRVGRKIRGGIAGIRIGLASRYNGTDPEQGIGSISSAGPTRVKYTAPDSATPGEAVKLIEDVETTIADGEDPSKWIRVTKTSPSDEDIAGAAAIVFKELFADLPAFADFENPDGSTVYSHYRAAFVRAAGANISAVKAWVGTLGPAAGSTVARLGGSGSGTITDVSDAFIGWPQKGACRIQTAGGALREIVFYSSRDGESLTVPTLGRGILGSSAAAGAADDVLYPVPLIRIAYEAASPLKNGPVALPANETTEPAGMSWSTAIAAGSGLAIGNLAPSQQVALRIHRQLPAAISPFSRYQVKIELQWASFGETFRETLSGLFRVGDDDYERYELMVGEDAPPGVDDVPADTAAAAGDLTTSLADGTYYVVTQHRNRYDLVSRSAEYDLIVVDGGEQISDPPGAPVLEDVLPLAGGAMLVQAVYWHRLDEEPADTWLVYLKVGSDPVPGVDAAVSVAMDYGNAATALAYETSAFTAGQEVHVLLRVRRTSDLVDSVSSEVIEETAADDAPGEIVGEVF